MKNLAEKITGIIGITGFIVIAALMFLFSNIISMDDFQEIMTDDTDELTGEAISEEELAVFMDQAETVNYTLDISLLAIFAVAGIIALITANKKPVLSAIILAGSSVIAGFIFWWMILPLLPVLIYMVTALLILLRNHAHKTRN